MRSPRMSICAPTGVARFFRLARCPSSASKPIHATVSATALRLSHGPRPNRNTAANPTATRRQVTRLGVQCIVHPWAAGGCAAAWTECIGPAILIFYMSLIIKDLTKSLRPTYDRPAIQKRHLSAFGFRIVTGVRRQALLTVAAWNTPPAMPVNSLSARFRAASARRQIWDNTKLLGSQRGLYT